MSNALPSELVCDPCVPHIGRGVIVAESAFIGPRACLLGQGDDSVPHTEVHAGASIGGNATIAAGVQVGAFARVAPGAVVLRSVPPYAIVEGNPARIVGYVETATGELRASLEARDSDKTGVQASRVRGVTLHRFRLVPDMRGSLTVGEFEREIPFLPRRYFLVFDVPTAETRGEHAHRECAQFLVAVSGSVSVVVDDGRAREEFRLESPSVGLHLPPMTWGIQYRYTPDAVLLVFASHYYDAGDYIRDYAQFLELVEGAPG